MTSKKSKSIPNFKDSGGDNTDDTFVIFESKSKSDPCCGNVSETSFIRKGIQEMISESNKLFIKRSPLVVHSKDLPLRTKNTRLRKPGGAYRVVPTSPSKADVLDSDSGSCCSLSDFEVVNDLSNVANLPPCSSRLSEGDIKEKNTSQSPKHKPPLEKCLSVDSANTTAKEPSSVVETASDSIKALNLSPSKKKKRKVIVPYRMTPDGTKINFLCDV
ncbi:hypothetical protein SK128_012130, partial [Halocaridina rubra]